ncbi:hypothetical protein [Sphingorhabdus sp. SMR4y]|uniref:hypothetical protein n=1 Tax=Sphingorhabdus sp. SMR4y TaxID=2584094 RepID=UPI000B6189AE|nr:hypothetical protein [Sphingorhabdus sp. SMR4y]ASK87273.1 hypothetical protein SPHFLASMR4Y_00487 [Sphingorhabdus sp. SMR4y]
MREIAKADDWKGRRLPAGDLDGNLEFESHLLEFGWTRSNLENAPREGDLQNFLLENYNSVQLERKKLLRPLSPAQAKKNSMSSFIGTGAQPLHTDCAYQMIPPQFVMLKCISTGESRCATSIGSIVWEHLEAQKPVEIYQSIWTFWDRVSTSFYSTIVHGMGRQARIRFDPFCMKSADNIESVEYLSRNLMNYIDIKDEYLDDGQWLLINNWRVLHGRSLGANLSPSREIERSYWS